jgi:hypothetical protein
LYEPCVPHCTTHSAALAEKRIALLIGNEAYASDVGRDPVASVQILEQISAFSGRRWL